MVWIFVGIILGIIFTYTFLKLRGRVLEVFQLTPTYIIATIIIIATSIILNILNLFFIASQRQEFFSGVVNFYSGLSLAALTGYFAFAQLQLNRFDKLKDEAYSYLKERQYLRARRLYEEAHSIKNNDFTVASNLAELYLILKDFSAFDNLRNQLDRTCVESKEKAISTYLITTKWLIKENVGSAKGELKKLLKIIEAEPKDFESSFWDFSDLEKSETYKSISGESKEILETLIKFANKSLENEKKEVFIRKYGS